MGYEPILAAKDPLRNRGDNGFGNGSGSPVERVEFRDVASRRLRGWPACQDRRVNPAARERWHDMDRALVAMLGPGYVPAWTSAM